ncbi:MAG: hypothetical protein C6I00_02835 [Nitratiruptor sp.]|nr:hypothetical protein [Nitratiruptor sp.]NPA82885.1 hypothetical protein [Campylobacterota bacterium]
MHISDEGIVTQLGFLPEAATLRQLNLVKEHTPGFPAIQRHIVALVDHLKPYGSYVTFSSSHPYLKVKIDHSNPTSIQRSLEELHKWASKYNITLEEVEYQRTYYIRGIL